MAINSNPVISEIKVKTGVKKWVEWWIGKRKEKLEKHLSGTMSINPFLAPIIFDYHGLDDLESLTKLYITSHLMIGNNTGFGKLIDEKILPNVFGFVKLDKNYRLTNYPLIEPCFDEIDHFIERQNGKKELLSLKAGRWTIQLTMAVQLNSSFNEILNKYPKISNNLVVGVFYGKSEHLTDKYDILRGINRGAHHNVVDLKDKVQVHSGREFWSWVNNGERNTQEWVLNGIIEATEKVNIREVSENLFRVFQNSVLKHYDAIYEDDEKINWQKLLKIING